MPEAVSADNGRGPSPCGWPAAPDNEHNSEKNTCVAPSPRDTLALGCGSIAVTVEDTDPALPPASPPTRQPPRQHGRGPRSLRRIRAMLAASITRPVPLLAAALLALAPSARADGPARNPEKVDFERHVMGLLGKMGCNAGSCHGSFQGKGGFRLSLFGYDPDFDYQALTRDTQGRRVDRANPDRSLL